MDIWRMAKRQGRAAAAPAVFLALSAYFIWHASQGNRGWVAYAERERDLVLAQQQLQRARDEVEVWARRVDGLRGAHLDADVLDERARAMLNVSDPADIVVMYPNDKKLF